MESRKGYLSIARKAGEYVQIDNLVTIYIKSVRGNEVRLGIRAPGMIVSRVKDQPNLGLLAEVGKDKTPLSQG